MKYPVYKFTLAVIVLSCLNLICIRDANAQIGIGLGFRIHPHRTSSSPEQNTEKQLQQMKRDLDLNDDQVSRIRPLLLDRNRIRKQGDKDAIYNDRFRQQLKEILTPEQYNKFQDIKQAKHADKKKSEKKPLPSSEWDDVYR